MKSDFGAAQKQDRIGDILRAGEALERGAGEHPLPRRLRQAVDDVGAGMPGGDGVDIDIRRELLRQRLGHVDDTGFRRRIVHHRRPPAMIDRPHRTHVDDLAAAGLAHMPRRGLAAQERPDQIDLKHPHPFRFGLVGEGAGHGHAGVVDENIDAAEAFDEAIDGAIDILLDRDVADKGLDLEIFRPAIRLGPGQAFLSLAHDPDRRTLAREQFCGGGADAAAASGHQRKPAIQSSHRLPPYDFCVRLRPGRPIAAARTSPGR